MWNLSNKDPKEIEKLLKLEPEQVEKIPEEGDGKAVFFGEGTEEEYKQFQKEEDGTAPWYKRIGL